MTDNEAAAQSYIDKLPGNFLDLVLDLSKAGLFGIIKCLDGAYFETELCKKIGEKLNKKYPGLDWQVRTSYDERITWCKDHTYNHDVYEAIMKTFKPKDRNTYDDARVTQIMAKYGREPEFYDTERPSCAVC